LDDDDNDDIIIIIIIIGIYVDTYLAFYLHVLSLTQAYVPDYG